MSNKKLRVFEAFAGVGSQSMALRNIGVNYEVVGTMDVDRYAILAYDAIHNEQIKVSELSKEEMIKEIHRRHICYNFSTGKNEIPRKEEDIRKLYEAHIRNKNFGDIRLVNVEELPDFDFFTYSFPCKNISVAGQQAGFDKDSGTQSSLVWECERLIKNKLPKYLMMENVKNIVGKNHIEDFNIWCDTLEALGYNNYWKVLNGKDFNVPQHRERVIMISIHKESDNGLFNMPSRKQGSNPSLKNILDIGVEDKYYLDRPWHFSTEKDSKHDNNEIAQLEGITYKAIRTIGDPNKLCRCIDAMLGGNRQPKVIEENISNKDIYSVDGYVARRLTPIECWRVQGFSDEDFYKAKDIGGLSNSKLYERAGRGIVVPMLEEIFIKLLPEYIN